MSKDWLSKKWFSLWMMVLAVFSFIGVSCNDQETPTSLTTTENNGYAETKVYATVYGQVIDALSQQPVAGVTVRLEGDKTYSATTDAQGFYRISNVYMGAIKALSGGGSGDDWGTNSIKTQTLAKTFPLFIDGGNKYATWQKNITLTVSYDLTAAGSVVLQSDTTFKMDTVSLYRKLNDFQVKVLYANGTAAANATVVFFANPWPDFYMENSQVVVRTDSEGKAIVDGLIAYDTYHVYAWVSEGDYNWYNFSYSNYYEDDYFSLWWYGFQTVNLTPCGPYVDWNYTSDSLVQENTLTVVLDNPQDVGLVDSNIDALSKLPADDTSPTIFFLFNLPVDATFSVTDKAGNAVAFTVSTSDKMYYEITFNSPLDPHAGPFDVGVQATAANGAQYANVWNNAIDFVGVDNVMLAAIAPQINLNRLNDADYTGYKVDWDAILLGSGNDTVPYGTETYGKTLELAWHVVENATDYQLWVSNNDTWMQVPLTIFYNDGTTIKAEATLPNDFDAWHDLDLDPNLVDTVFAPYYGGQVLKLKILPVNGNGWVDYSQLNMNTPFLSLADNWGPEIVKNNKGIFGTSYGNNLNFDGVSYDSEVNIPFDEPVQLDNLTVNPGEGEYGVTKESGYFDIKAVSWPDPDPEGELPVGFYLKVQLSPSNATEATVSANASVGDTSVTVNALGPLSVGDTVQIGNDNYTVAGFCADQNLLYLGSPLAVDVEAGTGVNLMGPTKGSADLQISTTGTYYTNILVVDNASGFSLGDYVLIGNQEINRVSFGGSATTLRLLNGIANTYPGGTSVALRTLTARTLVSSNASEGDTTVTVAATTNLDVGDFIAIGSWDNYYQITSVNTTTNTIGISPALRSDVAANTPVYEYTEPASPVETTLKIGAPVINVFDATGIVAGASLSIGNENATVKGVYGSYVAIESLLEGTYTDVALTIDVSGLRDPDVLQVKVRDMSGNLASTTDKDGDGNADYDEVDGNNDIY